MDFYQKSQFIFVPQIYFSTSYDTLQHTTHLLPFFQQHITAHSGTLQHVAAHYSTQLIFSLFSSSTLQHTVAHYSTWQHTTAHNSSSLFFPVTHYSTQQHTTANHSTLQHTPSSPFFPAAHYSTHRNLSLFLQQYITAHHKKKIKIK